MSASSGNVDNTCTIAVDKWYAEVSFYNFKAARLFADNWNQPNAIGHFTQLVWKSTTSMGCGVAQGTYTSSGGWKGTCKVVVCR